MSDVLFIHNDGTTQSFPSDCSVAANLYAITHASKIRAVYCGDEKIVYKDGNPVASLYISREQVLDQI